MFALPESQWRNDGTLQALLEEYICSLFMKENEVSTKCIMKFSRTSTRRKAELKGCPCYQHVVKRNVKLYEPNMQLNCKSMKVKSSVHH